MLGLVPLQFTDSPDSTVFSLYNIDLVHDGAWVTTYVMVHAELVQGSLQCTLVGKHQANIANSNAS